MATSFPSSLDSFTNPSATDALDSVSVPHADQHADLNDAVEALQAKVGVDGSAVTSSLDYQLANFTNKLGSGSGDTYPWAAGEVLNAADLNAAIGIVQIVRATDTTNRTTTSSSFTDAGISVTITPTSASNNVMIVWLAYVGQTNYGYLQIADASNVAIAGADNMGSGSATGVDDIYDAQIVIGYDSPATTSATTYKGRFRRGVGTASIFNGSNTGQMFAIEVKP